MPNNVAPFAIHADDLPRARQFYERAFGWHFEPWGPPDFFSGDSVERLRYRFSMIQTCLVVVGKNHDATTAKGLRV